MTRSLRAFFIGSESEGGQAIILIAITLLGMLMMVGVAIDAGQVYSARRAMQEAADAAAYAASVTLYQGGSQAQAFQAAKDDATTNGFTDGASSTTVTVAQPTTSPYNTSEYVEVTIVRNITTALVPAQSAITVVTVHAISGAESLNNNYAIMALDRNATNDAFKTGASASITLNGGGILVNSTGSTAANSSTPLGNWNIACPSTNPCNIDIGGGDTGSWPAASSGSPNYFDGTRTSQPQQTDPFAGYPKPSTTGLTLDPAGFGPSNKTLQSGIYDYTISGKNFCHGIYNIGEDTTTADPTRPGYNCDGKVFIFNTLSNYPASGGTCTGMVVSGNHDVTLAAMTTGTYAGLFFYQDSTCAAALDFGGTSFELTVTGTIYLPNAAFTSNGSSHIVGGQIVAKTLDLGNATVDITFNAGTSAQPKLPRLAK
ncbi:MAG: hypothetical protein AUH85_10540 [Chloroflexi bacterium 13_1_40CM_4_68_4]|nr:MAG: hypothetical protein AUH85_10540 [Chloroflexi bacterium 13_1_40CM_4_68_4]